MEKIQESKETCQELLAILACCDKEIIEKIPASFLQEVMNIAGDSNSEYYLEGNKALDEQKISDECKNLIGLMYYSYIADEDEKRELQEIWNKNEKKYNEEIQAKFNINDIFNTKQESSNKKIDNSKLAMIEYKESIIRRIINKIRGMF